MFDNKDKERQYLYDITFRVWEENVISRDFDGLVSIKDYFVVCCFKVMHVFLWVMTISYGKDFTLEATRSKA